MDSTLKTWVCLNQGFSNLIGLWTLSYYDILISLQLDLRLFSSNIQQIRHLKDLTLQTIDIHPWERWGNPLTSSWFEFPYSIGPCCEASAPGDIVSQRSSPVSPEINHTYILTFLAYFTQLLHSLAVPKLHNHPPITCFIKPDLLQHIISFVWVQLVE